MGKDKKTRWIEEAVKNLEKHEFKCLASWGEAGEIWEGSRPGSSTYALTICVTRMGIAVVGDIDGLIFNVGSNYGLPFLAGNDVSYYIHSKLEHSCKARELATEKLLYTVTERVMNHLFGSLDDEDIEIIERALGNKLPEMVFDSHKAAQLPKDCKELVQALCHKHEVIEGIYADELDLCPDWIREKHHADCLALIEDAEGISDIHEAYEILNGFNVFSFDEIDIDAPSESLMVRLYMVNEAAKKIMQLKEGEAEARAVGSCA
jgi:hypothetical protein